MLNFLAMNEAVCKDLTEWADSCKMEDITEDGLREWMALEVTWGLDQVYFLLMVKLEGLPRDQVVNHFGSGSLRGALAWKHVQSTAAGLTDNRLHCLTKQCMNPTRVKSVEETAAAMAAWERDMRELDRHPTAALNEQQKISCVRRLVPESMEENLFNHAESFDTYAKLKKFVDHQVALRRPGRPALLKGTSSTATFRRRLE